MAASVGLKERKADPVVGPAGEDARATGLSAADVVWPLVTGALVLAALYLMFLWVPMERTMGVVQRIFYFKVASAFVSFFAFIAGGVFSILYLMKRELRYDERSVACNEAGLVFAVSVLIMGMMWAKPVWGIYWAWTDPKLMTMMILALIYFAYIALRNSVSEPNQRAVVCAVVSIFGMIDIPIVYKANEWWRTQHPAPVLTGDGSIDPEMRFVLYFSTLALTVLLAYMVRMRTRVEAMSREVEGCRRQVHSL